MKTFQVKNVSIIHIKKKRVLFIKRYMNIHKEWCDFCDLLPNNLESKWIGECIIK